MIILHASYHLVDDTLINKNRLTVTHVYIYKDFTIGMICTTTIHVVFLSKVGMAFHILLRDGKGKKMIMKELTRTVSDLTE
jgi:ferredoxin-fold anticodon binding domain-containing protein